MASRSDQAKRNRELMPNAAALIDEWRQTFPDLKVIYAKDKVTGYEVGNPVEEGVPFSIPFNYYPSTPVEMKGRKKK